MRKWHVPAPAPESGRNDRPATGLPGRRKSGRSPATEPARYRFDPECRRHHTWFAEWMRTCYRQDLIALVKQADQFDGFSKEKQKGLLDYSMRLYRDLFLWQQGAAELLRLPDDEMAFVKNFAKILTINHIEQHCARPQRSRLSPRTKCPRKNDYAGYVAHLQPVNTNLTALRYLVYGIRYGWLTRQQHSCVSQPYRKP